MEGFVPFYFGQLFDKLCSNPLWVSALYVVARPLTVRNCNSIVSRQCCGRHKSWEKRNVPTPGVHVCRHEHRGVSGEHAQHSEHRLLRPARHGSPAPAGR